MPETVNTLSTPQDVKTKLATVVLDRLEFLDTHGNAGARGQHIKHARLAFVDGDALTMTRAEFDGLTDADFRLSFEHETANV